MSWARDPKDLYDVRAHRFGIGVAEKMAKLEQQDILKNQQWKKNTPEQQRCITTGVVKNKTEETTGKIKYSIDEITVAIILYGKNSAIHKAMLNGEKVSLLIRKSIEEKIKRGVPKDGVEESLLASCIKKENAITV